MGGSEEKIDSQSVEGSLFGTPKYELVDHEYGGSSVALPF